MNEWISVNNSLPEKYGMVLAFTECGDIDVVYFFVDTSWGGTDKITHWMPLPDAPKE
tara:strand:+ start:76 stop:246 length:171 start_codon:yes stop_codon:yes gene_type:complete